MNETLNNQETIRRYLLGDLDEENRAALEDRFLGDAELFEQIEDAENDLVDDYVGERLAAPEHKLFESYYLALPENRAKVETAAVLRREMENAKSKIRETAAVTSVADSQMSFWLSIRNFFASLHLAPVAAGAAILLFIGGGLWFALRQNQTGEIAFTPTPQTSIQNVQPSPIFTPPDANVSENGNRIDPRPSSSVQTNTNAAPKESPQPSIEPKTRVTPPAAEVPRTVTLALVTGLVRGGGGEANKLILPANAQNVRLTFDLPAKNYRDVEARIETVAGAGIWRGKIKQTGGRAALNLPATLFADEDYLLIVSGANESGERKDFAEIYFNAKRK